MKDDKKKLIDDAVAELKNAGGDAPAAAAKTASPKKPVSTKVEKPPKIEKKAAPAKKAGAKKPAKKVVKETSESGPPKEAEFSDDIAIDKCNEVFGENVVKEVQNSAWKARLEHLQIMNNKCSILGTFNFTIITDINALKFRR